MSGINPKRFKNSADESVEEENREGSWPVYDWYEVRDDPGGRWLFAPWEKEKGVLNERWNSAPLSGASTSLFLEFSNWPVEQRMDKAIETIPGARPSLDTDRNAAAARTWAETYGVLGVLSNNPNETHSVGSSMRLHRTTAIYTGALDFLPAPNRAYRMSTRGGESETVAAFAFEAWQAYLARRLYELASRKVLDEAAIVRLMDDTPWVYNRPPNASPARPKGPSEREMNSRNSESIRSWALEQVAETVTFKVENTCYPTVVGSPGSYKQGWGFKSLLGAMWLQMMWLMLAENNQCRWCGYFFERTRADKRFCNADCRQRWNYYEGKGKSSKQSKAGKYRRRG